MPHTERGAVPAQYERTVAWSGPPPLAPARRGRQAVGLLAVLTSLTYLVWRWGATLPADALWLGVPLALAETITVLTTLALVFSCWRTTDRPSLPPAEDLSVAVLIATYDEPPDVLRATVLGALALRHPTPVPVVVLDDGGRAWVQEMCAELGARYLSRPAPRAHAKAGNLNHGIAHVDADLLVTLDADHVPRPDMLERTLGEFRDPRVALVQGPQVFFNRGFQHPLRPGADPTLNDQSVFFGPISRGKDRHGAAFWCGCPAVLRREALLSVGGVATDTLVEDAHTALRMHRAGWRSVYRDEVLAVGLAPEEIGAYMVQRGRWAQGAFQVLRRDNPLFGRGLTWQQRIHYLFAFLHYLEGPQRLVFMLVPPVVLFTGILPLDTDPVLYAALFLPPFVLLPLATRAFVGDRYRFLDGEVYGVVKMGAYTRAAWAYVRPGRGRFRVTPKGARSDASPLRHLRLPLVVAAVTLVAIGYQAAAQVAGLRGALPPFAYSATVLWALVCVATVVAAMWRATAVRHRRRSHRFPVSLRATVGRRDERAPRLPATVVDLNQFGLAMRVSPPPPPGLGVAMVLLLDDGPVSVTGTVTTTRREEPRGGEALTGVRFDPLSPATEDAIVRWCHRHPFGPQSRLDTLPPVPDAAPVAVPAAAESPPA